MRITLTRHGGHMAGMTSPTQSVDVNALDARQAAELTELVKSAVSSRSAAAPARAVPDAMTYSITIDDSGGSTTIKESDAAMSRPFAALLDYLERLP